MSEIEIFTTEICNGLQGYGEVSAEDIVEVENAISCELGEVAFTICKLLISFGYTKQEENNRIALEVLAKSILKTIKVIEESGGKYSHLFYRWINYSEREESDSKKEAA